jgi:hypothetical protein
VHKLLAIMAIIAGVYMLPTASAENFEYVNPVNELRGISIQTFPPQAAGGDLAYDAVFCEKREGFVCITSKPINFAVPLPLSKDRREWEYGGIRYEVIRRGDFMLLGQHDEVLHIKSESNSVRLLFVYSPHRGLLAIEGSIDGHRQVFVSVQRRGFGAQPAKTTHRPRR